MEEETSFDATPPPGEPGPRSLKESDAVDEPYVISAEQSGDWMPAEDLKQHLLKAFEESSSIQISLGALTYLETSSLQVLLAVADSIQQGRVHLQPVTDELKRVICAAGADCLLSERMKQHDDQNVAL